MLEMLDRNSADGQRATALAHHREHYRDLDFNVATGESYANLRKAAFRIVKESLANACRHSKSKRLFAELSVDTELFSGFDFGTGESTSTPSAPRLDALG